MENLQEETGNAVSAGVETLSALVIEYSLSVVGAIIILIIGFIIAGLVKRWVRKAILATKHGDETLAGFLSTAARYAVLAIVIIMVLSQFGVQTASIIAALGAVGLAIGLALQGSLQNVASGIIILFLRPFKVGDYIDAGSVAGKVVDIGLLATELRSFDGLYVMAPNSQLWGDAVTNYSRTEERRFDLAIGIGYDDDINAAMTAMRSLIEGDDRVLSDPEPFYYVDTLGDSAVTVTARVWTKGSDWWATTRDLTKRAKEAFDDKGINIPFPQRDIHIIKDAAE